MKRTNAFLFSIFLVFHWLLICSNTVYAHSPHDDISDIVLSSNYAHDKTLFIIVKNKWLLKSMDGGYSWQNLVNGIDNIHHLSSISISSDFKSDKTLFLSTKGDGLYRSQDGGSSWIKINNGLNELTFNVIHASSNYSVDKTILTLSSNGVLYISTNRGDSWKQIVANNINVTAIVVFPKKDNAYVLFGDDRGGIYLYSYAETTNKLYEIKDAGSITSFAIHENSTSGDIFFVGTEKRGIFKTVDGGVSFKKCNIGLSQKHILSVTISRNYNEDKTVFATSWYEAPFISMDGGGTWQKYNKGVTTNQQAHSVRYAQPQFTDIQCTNTFFKDKTIFLGGFDGLFKTIDGGNTWVQLETLPVFTIKGIALSPGLEDSYSIAVSTYGGGAYFSSDKGNTWSVRNIGLKTTRLSDLAFSPNYHSDNLLFSASARYFLTLNTIETGWTGTFIKATSWRSQVYKILNTLHVSRDWLQDKLFKQYNLVTVWPNIIALSPNYASDNTLFFGSRYKGIFKSTDGGNTFSLVWDDLDQIHLKKVTSLAISPNFHNDGTIFAGIRWEGIFQSSNGGTTWRRQNKGLSFNKLNDSIIPTYYSLAISPAFEIDQTVFAGTENGLFITSDRGVHWRPINNISNSETHGIKAIAISPEYGTDLTVIISVEGKGLFKTENGGKTWAPLAKELINQNYLFNFIKFSPLYGRDQTLYGVTTDALFRSTDSGNNWHLLKIPIARYENNRNAIRFEGNWEIERSERFSASSISFSDISKSKVILDFVGTGIKWIGTKSNKRGIAKVLVDGAFKGNIDQFDEEQHSLVELFSLLGMPHGPHTIKIEVSGKKNPNSLGYGVDIDAFDVIR